MREASFADDAAELRKDVPEDQVLDITVTCDGTFARRGFNLETVREQEYAQVYTDDIRW